MMNKAVDYLGRYASSRHKLGQILQRFANRKLTDYEADDIAAAGSVEWVGYLSTTGVYGNRDGDWVDEASDLRPSSPRSERRVTAERAWLEWGDQTGIPVQIFRLAGIYGPGRSVADQIKAGTARRIAKPGHLFSRIHVEDIATVVSASMVRPRAGGIYNVCDDEPFSGKSIDSTIRRGGW